LLCFAHLLVDDENEEEEERAVYTRGAVDEHEAAEGEEEDAAREKSLEDIPTDTFLAFFVLFFCEESARDRDRKPLFLTSYGFFVTNNFFTKKFFLLYTSRLAKPDVFVFVSVVVVVVVCFPNVFVQRLGAVLREIRVVSLDDAEKFVEVEATKRTSQSEIKRGNKSGCFLFARGG